MKIILLLRHGKSDWTVPYNNDHDRPLSKRGIKASKKIGNYICQIEQIPRLVISSSAKRAKETAKLAINSGKWDSTLSFDEKIYESSTKDLLNILHKQDKKINNICLVGHEPTFSSFISRSTRSNWMKFPTCALAKIEFNSTTWKEIKFGDGVLKWIKTPKDIS